MFRGRFAIELIAPTKQNEATMADIPLGVVLAKAHPSRSAVHQEIEEPLEWSEDSHHQYDWIVSLVSVAGVQLKKKASM